MNLQELYEGFSKQRELWDYYVHRGNITFPNSLLSDDTQEGEIEKECSSFIKKYVVLSEKGENNLFQDWKLILDGTKINPSIENQHDINNQKSVLDGLQKVLERSKHIVSTFFLGLILYNEIPGLKDSIIEEMQKIPFYKKLHRDNSVEPTECERQFIFLWFMASLFHDLGYIYEVSQIEEDCLKMIKRVTDSKIWSDYRNYKLRGNHIPLSYPIQTCKCYFNCYRWHESKKLDHGITAACMLYDSLCKIREEKCKKTDGRKDPSWDIGLKKVYYVISWIILVHNIWFSSDLEIEEKKNGETENQRKKYELYHLNSLIKKKEDVYPIQYDEYPLQFLFCLVDSIEPLKRNIPLSMIELDFKDKAIEITIQGCSDKSKSYIKGLTELKYWLTKTVEENDNKIRIVLDNTNQLIA